MGRFEARLEVDNREALADNSLMSYSVARTERFVGNILAGNKANSRFPDAGAVADRNSRHTDLGDMLDNASDALVESNLAVGAAAADHIDMAVLALYLHLLSCWVEIRKRQEEERMNEFYR